MKRYFNTVLLVDDLKRLPILLLGFLLLSFGIWLTRESQIGMSPWGVFHDGLGKQVNMDFGTMIVIVGFIILAMSVIFLKSKVGIGTILNIAIVGNFINFLDYNLDFEYDSIFLAILVMSIGLLLMTFGRSLYISAKLGPGPRDGVFVGVSRLTKIDVKYVKPAIEFSILLIGYLLGGIVGIGTIISILVTSRLVHLFFKLLHFDPKSEHQSNFFDYFQKNAN